jgi:cytochrome c biogenesis protein CcmG/thiol:disulfide interchange protein DsbE
VLWSGIGKDPHLLPSVLIDKPAPEFSAGSLAAPETIISKQSLLGKPYLLNVFGSWCISCRDEHPVLMEYARQGGIRLIGLNWNDTRADAQRWLKQFGDPYEQIIYDADGRLAIDFGVTGAPESFVISADGRVLYKFIGPLYPEEIEKRIKPLLAGSGS